MIEQPMVKRGDDIPLGRGEMNQDIATTDQIQPGEGRILEQVVAAEHELLAQLARNQVAIVQLRKVALQALLRNIRCDARGVLAFARSGDGGFADVRSKDAHWKVRVRLALEIL